MRRWDETAGSFVGPVERLAHGNWRTARRGAGTLVAADRHGVTRYGGPSAESLAHLPAPREGIGPWLRGQGPPGGAPPVAVAALGAAVAGAAASLVGATLPWITGSLSDRGVELFSVSYRGTGHDLLGFLVVVASLGVVAAAAASRARPSRPWRALAVAVIGVAVLVLAGRALGQLAATRRRLLSVPLFLDNTTGIHARAAIGFGWWLTVAGGMVTLVAGVTAFGALAVHGRRRA
jgi:hypothetical protein